MNASHFTESNDSEIKQTGASKYDIPPQHSIVGFYLYSHLLIEQSSPIYLRIKTASSHLLFFCFRIEQFSPTFRYCPTQFLEFHYFSTRNEIIFSLIIQTNLFYIIWVLELIIRVLITLLETPPLVTLTNTYIMCFLLTLFFIQVKNKTHRYRLI